MADPSWPRPLDGRYAAARGGSWNAPGSFPVVYLFGSVALARSFVLAKHDGAPYSVLDMQEDARPILIETDVETVRFVDIVTDRGCAAARLPTTYPRDENGDEVGWERCRPIGHAAWGQGEPGIARRSATARPGDVGEELAWFQRSSRLTAAGRRRFDEWFS